MIRLRAGQLAAAVTVAVVTFPPSVFAQFRAPPATPAYAIQNATVMHADGRVEAGITIVIRGHLIEAMGASVAVPPDAEVLEGDSLFVYPGLVDAHGAAEVQFPEIEPDDSVRSWNAPREVQGLLAHRRVADHLAHTAEGGAEHRANGIVAAGIWPDGALAAGLGAAIVHRTAAAPSWEFVANENIGLAMAFQSGRGGAYPGTLFGILAYMRQSFEDARRDGLILAAYERDPSGLAMPRVDPDYAVLRSVMNGETPVYFAADRAEDVRRVLKLSEEYGFQPVIVGGDEAWRVAGALAERDVPVLIDGDFPQPDEWEPVSDEADSTTADSTQAAAAAPMEPEMLDPAAAREKKRIEDIRSNAARLDSAGVRIAITSGGGDANLLGAARLAVEYGLPEEAALRALTSAPATMLGIPHVVQFGPDRAATFVAMTGPIFDDETEIVHTFVEGGYTEGASAGGGGDAPAVNVTGEWTWTMSAAGQEFEMEASLEMTADGTVRGNASNDLFGSAPVRGRVSGTRFTFTIAVSAGGQSVELSGEGTVEGDRFSGSGESPFGAFSVSGVKNPGGAQ